MTALKSFRYGGKRLNPGDQFDVSRNLDARILSLLRWARENDPGTPEKSSREISETPEEPEKVAALVQKRKGRYRRRDMKAEDA